MGLGDGGELNRVKPTRLHRKGEPFLAEDGLWRLLAIVLLVAFSYYAHAAIFSVISPAVRYSAEQIGILDRPQSPRSLPKNGGDWR